MLLSFLAAKIWWWYSGHMEIFQSHVLQKIFQNLCMRLKFNIRLAMKIKQLVAREIQYSELGIFSFNLYVHYITRGFTASARAFKLLIRAFNLSTRAFSTLTFRFKLVPCGFELLTRVLLFDLYIVFAYFLLQMNSLFLLALIFLLLKWNHIVWILILF